MAGFAVEAAYIDSAWRPDRDFNLLIYKEKLFRPAICLALRQPIHIEYQGQAEMFTTTTSRIRIRVRIAAALSAVFFTGAVQAALLTEGFESFLPSGWTIVNNSTGPGPIAWFAGNTGVVPAHAGSSYAAANFNSAADVPNATISDWLISPTLLFANGDVVTFYSRRAADVGFPDRLELRFSDVGGVDVGTTESSVGTFTQLLLSINPGLTSTGYPEVWTQFTATIAGLPGPTSGAIAFRYFVTDAGPQGSNSDYIGVDTLSIAPAVVAAPEPATWLLAGVGVSVLMMRRRRSRSAG